MEKALKGLLTNFNNEKKISIKEMINNIRRIIEDEVWSILITKMIYEPEEILRNIKEYM